MTVGAGRGARRGAGREGEGGVKGGVGWDGRVREWVCLITSPRGRKEGKKKIE